jgi:hypothetical protein
MDMDMRDPAKAALSEPRPVSRVAPPPMLVIHRGWFRTTVTERQAADLAREDQARDRQEQRSA